MTDFVDMTTPIEAMDDATLTMVWYRVDQQLSAVKVRELELRKALFARSFPNPDRGVGAEQEGPVRRLDLARRLQDQPLGR